jgi:hypothetical protein
MGGLPFPGYEGEMDDLVYRGEGDPMAQMRDLVLRFGDGEGFGDAPEGSSTIPPEVRAQFRERMPARINDMQGGGLPSPSFLSPDTRKIILDQIQRLNQPRETKFSMWTDPAFLAGMTLLGGGKMGQAAQVAAQAQARADQSREYADAHRATALSSLTGRLTEADKAAAMEAKGKRDAVGKALSLVAPTQRGRFGKLIQETGTDPTDPVALQALIEQSGLPLAPNLKAVPGVGLVDMSGEQPKVVIGVQRAPPAPSEAERLLIAAGYVPGTPEYRKKAAELLGKKTGEGGGPFAGNAEDIQLMNYLLNPKSDPASPEYAMAHWKLTQPRQQMVPNEKGEPTLSMVTPVLPPNIRPPVYAQAAPQGTQPATPQGASGTPQQAPGAQSPGPGVSVRPIAPPALDKTAKAKMDTIITEASTLSNALDDYVAAVENAGAGERIQSVAGISTPSNTAYNNAALLAKGEQLYNLGVLNGPDLVILQKTLADPSTFKGQVAGPEAAKAAADSVRRLIQDRVNLARQQQGLPPLDIQKQGQSVRQSAPVEGGDPAKEGRFSGMARHDLARIDPKTLKPEEAAQWRAAAKRILGE